MDFSYLKEHYGDIASVIGLLWTIAAVVAARGAKRAAEEAKQAAKESLARIKSQLLALEIERASELVKSIDASCRDQNWSTVLSKCVDFTLLISRVTQHDRLSSSESESLTQAIRIMGDLSTYVQNIRDDKRERRFASKRYADLHDVIVILGRLQSKLQNLNMEID